MAKPFSRSRGFFNPVVIKKFIAAQEAAKAAEASKPQPQLPYSPVSPYTPPAPTGDVSTGSSALRAQYDTFILEQKAAFTAQMKKRFSKFKGRGPAIMPPHYPTFEQWLKQKGLGLSLGLGTMSDGVSGLGADIFTQFGKNLKGGLVRWVAPAVSKVTGVKVSKVQADLMKTKTRINVGKIVANTVLKPRRGVTVRPLTPESILNPVIESPLQTTPDMSDGTPVTNQGNGQGNKAIAGAFVMPKYVLPVVGGVVVIGVIYFIAKKR